MELGCRKLILVLAILCVVTLRSNAETGTLSEDLESTKKDKFPVSAHLSYGVLTDYADRRDPRSYRHSFSTGLGYEFGENWEAGLSATMATETIDGQISKGPEETHAETLDPSVEFELGYSRKFGGSHSYSLSGSFEPLLTEDSRIEGHKALIGAGFSLSLGFFAKRYTMSHSVSSTQLINQYRYSTDGNINPDYFMSYSFGNSIRFWKTYKLSHNFGLRATRYLDGFVGYSYSQRLSIAKSWQSVTVALSYTNGGFTDDGYVRLWYIDQYRRLFQLGVSYAF